MTLENQAISAELLEILACPTCEDRPGVELRDGALRCVKCGRVYPIVDGIPMMLVDAAAHQDDSKGE